MEAFKNDGHVYTTPCRIQLPYIFGKDSDTDKMTGLSSIADEMELMRENDPDAYLMGLPSAKGMMRVFSPACVPAWRTRDGALDNEAVSDFLRQTKRMYDAQMEGLPEEAAETWKGIRVTMRNLKVQPGRRWRTQIKCGQGMRRFMYWGKDASL